MYVTHHQSSQFSCVATAKPTSDWTIVTATTKGRHSRQHHLQPRRHQLRTIRRQVPSRRELNYVLFFGSGGCGQPVLEEGGHEYQLSERQLSQAAGRLEEAAREGAGQAQALAAVLALLQPLIEALDRLPPTEPG